MGCMGYEVDRPVSNYSAGETADGSGGGGGSGDAPYLQRLKSNRILRVLERTLLVGGALDAEALCVRSGFWVWRLQVEISLLDDGGNALDACVLSAVAALRHYRLPEVDIGGNEDNNLASTNGYKETVIIHSDDREPVPLPLHHTPLTATFALFADDSGATTAVSALLDPFDREELACDGLLTWSFNKYGEMCCLDFPGGCELRPRQLMAAAKLGRKRCVEICEMLETALDEAENKAQSERMQRLKRLDEVLSSQNVVMTSETTPASHEEENATQKEDEEYRQRALDYSSGHFAASVKEDKGTGSSERKKAQGETSSLFNAILQSAKSTVVNMPEENAATVVINKKNIAEKNLVKVPKNHTQSKIKDAKPNTLPVPLESDEEETVHVHEFTSMEIDAPEELDKEPEKKVEREHRSVKKSKGEICEPEKEVTDLAQ